MRLILIPLYHHSLTHSLTHCDCTSAGVLAYNVSKAALDQFTRCVSLELAAKQIRVNSVNPGVIVTELQKRGGLDTERYEKFLEHSKTTHALGRPGEAGEVSCIIRDIARNVPGDIVTGGWEYGGIVFGGFKMNETKTCFRLPRPSRSSPQTRRASARG